MKHCKKEVDPEKVHTIKLVASKILCRFSVFCFGWKIEHLLVFKFDFRFAVMYCILTSLTSRVQCTPKDPSHFKVTGLMLLKIHKSEPNRAREKNKKQFLLFQTKV